MSDAQLAHKLTLRNQRVAGSPATLESTQDSGFTTRADGSRYLLSSKDISLVVQESDPPEFQESDMASMLSACKEASISDSSLLDTSFKILSIMREFGVIPSPRYHDMSPWARRLSHTEYRRCRPTILKMKVLLHLDSFMNSVGETILDLGKFREGLSERGALSLLRVSIRELTGVNPKRFTFRRPNRQTLRSRNYEANLELNKAFSPNPELEGPGFLPKDVKKTSLGILKDILEEPSQELLRKIAIYEVNLTKSQMYKGSFIPKPGAATDQEYEEGKPLVRKFHFWRDKIVPLLEKVKEERRARAYEYESELQHILFIELQLRYDRFLWYLLTHDFRSDPPYVRIRNGSLAPPKEPAPPMISTIEGFLSVNTDGRAISIISDYMYKRIKIPPLETLLKDLSVGSTPGLFVNRGTLYYAVIVQYVSDLRAHLMGKGPYHDWLEYLPTSSLSEAASNLENAEIWAMAQHRAESSIPLELAIEFRRLLRLPMPKNPWIERCGCTLDSIAQRGPSESTHRHKGRFHGDSDPEYASFSNNMNSWWSAYQKYLGSQDHPVPY